MKILQIIPWLGLGGAEVMCENLCNELKNMGHDVTVVSFFNKNTAITERMNENGIPVLFLNKQDGFDCSVFKKLFDLIKSIKPDVVHTHLHAGMYAVPVAMFSGVRRIVYTVHNVASKETTKLGKLLNQVFFRFRRVTPVALSASIQKTILEVYHLSEDKVPVVLNGVALEKCIVKNDYSIAQSAQIINVARMMEVKNHHELLKGFRLLLDKGIDARLTLIGDGELRDSVLEQIQHLELQERVKLIPKTDNVYPFLSDADIFILPSKYEGIPMSIIEAMGTGLPIVASKVGGIPDMLENNQSALLCEPNAEAISVCLERFIGSETLRTSCGENARNTSSRFSSKIMAEQYEKIYQLL